MPDRLASDTIGLISFWQYEKVNGFSRCHSFIVPEPKPFKDINAHKHINDRMSYLFTSRDNEVFFFCAGLNRECADQTVTLYSSSSDDDDQKTNSIYSNSPVKLPLLRE